MSSLSEIYFKKETLQTLLDVVTKKGEKGVSITVSISDESNEYGQNISAYVSQTKEQREEGKKRFYVANGRVKWEDGKITKGVKPEDKPAAAPSTSGTSSDKDDDPLPF